MAISFSDKSIANRFPNSKIIRKAFDTGCNFTIHDYSKIWFQRRQRNWAYSTRRGYSEKYRNHIFKNWGSFRLSEFQPSTFSDWAAQSTLSAKTINEVRNIINQIFETAVVDKIIADNPIRYIKKLKHSVTEPDPFKPAEIESILKCLTTPYRQFFQFAFFSGMRTGELLGLRWEDVDMQRRVIHVRLNIVHGFEKEPKTKGSLRTLDLHQRAIDALCEIEKSDYYDPHRVFIDPDTMKTYSYADKLRKYVWKPALLKASVPYRKPYFTRHTYASLMLSQGKPPIWVARQLGHSDLSMLSKTYGRWINLT